jgi:polyhydroxyalkanoate synthesis regulator phasin
VSAGRGDPAARQAAVIAELDAIGGRLARGELTQEEAERLSDASMRRAHAETVAWVRTTSEGRAHQRRLRIKR